MDFHEKLHKKRQYAGFWTWTDCIPDISTVLGNGNCRCSGYCFVYCLYEMRQTMSKGDNNMKIVVVDRPKFFGFFLRKFFGIPKVKDIVET